MCFRQVRPATPIHYGVAAVEETRVDTPRRPPDVRTE
jgi:hypothetical protein